MYYAINCLKIHKIFLLRFVNGNQKKNQKGMRNAFGPHPQCRKNPMGNTIDG